MRRVFAWLLVLSCLLAALGAGLLSAYAPPAAAEGVRILHTIAGVAGLFGGIGAFFLVLDAICEL